MRRVRARARTHKGRSSVADVLSQDEIQALLAAMGGNEDDNAAPMTATAGVAPAPGFPESGTGRASPATPSFAGSSFPQQRGGAGATRARRHGGTAAMYQPYDFRRPDKFSKDQMRTLQMLHEAFARMYASSLSAYLRASVSIELLSAEQVSHDEFVRSLSGMPLLAVFSLPPLSGQAILEADINLFFGMMDRLLGGPGQAQARRGDLTDIEKSIASQILRRALHELKNAWEAVTPLEPELDAVETSTQFVQIVPPNDTVVLLLFQLKIGDVLGTMTLCLPYVALKPIGSKLSAQRWFASSTGKRAPTDPGHAQQISRLIQTTHVPCIARLGTARITVEDLLRLAPGDTVLTGTPQGADIDVLVGSNVKFRAQPGTRRRKMVLRIQNVVEPNPEDEDPLAPWR